jgi:hypothetical protein
MRQRSQSRSEMLKGTLDMMILRTLMVMGEREVDNELDEVSWPQTLRR